MARPATTPRAPAHAVGRGMVVPLCVHRALRLRLHPAGVHHWGRLSHKDADGAQRQVRNMVRCERRQIADHALQCWCARKPVWQLTRRTKPSQGHSWPGTISQPRPNVLQVTLYTHSQTAKAALLLTSHLDHPAIERLASPIIKSMLHKAISLTFGLHNAAAVGKA